MAYVADYDASGFDQSDPLTWPTPAPYEPGQWWYVTVAGTVNGTAVEVGDRVYPVGTGRLWGELNYGDAVFGGPVPDPPWPADPYRVRWAGRAWSSAPAWDRPPGPYDGAPFGDTGWRIAVEILIPVPGARLFGDLNYGDAVFGDTIPVAVDWHDVACHVSGAVIGRGGDDGSPLVDVDRLTLEIVDDDGSVAAIGNRPRTGGVFTPIRLSLIDPTGNPHALFTGRIERLADDVSHGVRTVAVEAFGMTADLVRDGTVARVEETASARLAALIAQTGYAWGVGVPNGGDVLRRIDRVENAGLRDLIDSTALSTRWQTHAAATGIVTWIPWPTTPDPGRGRVVVADCLGSTALAAVNIELVADTGELVTVATAMSDEVQGSPELSATATDPTAVARWGRRTGALGFPAAGLAAKQAGLDALVDEVVDRYSRVVNRVESIDVDTWQDNRWLAVLADLDVAQQLDVNVTVPAGTVFSTVVVGVEHSITPGRIRSTIRTSTLTTTD